MEQAPGGGTVVARKSAVGDDAVDGGPGWDSRSRAGNIDAIVQRHGRLLPASWSAGRRVHCGTAVGDGAEKGRQPGGRGIHPAGMRTGGGEGLTITRPVTSEGATLCGGRLPPQLKVTDATAARRGRRPIVLPHLRTHRTARDVVHAGWWMGDEMQHPQSLCHPADDELSEPGRTTSPCRGIEGDDRPRTKEVERGRRCVRYRRAARVAPRPRGIPAGEEAGDPRGIRRW